MHRIAVLIPAYNEEDNTKHMLESLLHQSIKPYYILVGDNDSEDNTAIVARKTLEEQGFKNYTIIRVRRYPNLGKLNINIVYSTLNKVLKKLNVNPDYVATIEADVILEDKYFEKLIEYFEKNPKLCIAAGSLEPLGLPKDSFPLRINVNLWGGNRLYRAEYWNELNRHIDMAYLPAWDTDHVVLAVLLGYHVLRIPHAKSHTGRSIRPFKGNPKGTTDALHGLPLWWGIYKAIQYRDPEYFKWFILTKCGKSMVTNKYFSELALIQSVYRYAATRVLMSRLTKVIHMLRTLTRSA